MESEKGHVWLVFFPFIPVLRLYLSFPQESRERNGRNAVKLDDLCCIPDAIFLSNGNKR